MTREEKRLKESSQRKVHWKRWGPYLSERSWGTVREDYSPDGAAWEFFPHDHARSRVYRWNEDGLAGICDRHQHICFAIALWNGKDPILKERLFGLAGPEGNHGEDVKECYFYLDSTPTHSYMKYLYKYPQAEFPYTRLVEENRRRTKAEPEFELIDSGVFDEDRYFDVFVEYAKASAEEILIRITVHNRGPEAARLDVLPTVWFRNTWSWGRGGERPIHFEAAPDVIELHHRALGDRWLICDGEPELLFTENETNKRRIFRTQNASPYVKDAFHELLVHGRADAVNPSRRGTKAAPLRRLEIAARSSAEVRLILAPQDPAARLDAWEQAGGGAEPFGVRFDEVFRERIAETDEFYDSIAPKTLSGDARNVARQAVAGLLWSKQFYHYVVRDWLDGDPGHPPPPPERRRGRNHEWTHVYNADVLLMPDKWEYPWYPAWDLAFHCVALASIDAEFAKEQLVLLLREWYQHPNGQLPAYEWSFSDVNPPVHAWAAWRVYKIDKKRSGAGDHRFLERVFQKLVLNFTWWVNRKDAQGLNIFQGGFLGLDNIGVFDRSAPLPTGGHLEQSDGTSWMAMYCLNLLAIALELARDNPAYEDMASKFWEHFLYIARAINRRDHGHADIWHEEDGFYYDVLHTPHGPPMSLKVRSMVGLIPLFAVETLEPELLHRLPDFERRMNWFIDNRPDLIENVASMCTPGKGERLLLSVVRQDQLRRVLKIMLDESEFLSPYGIRSLSRRHRDQPFVLRVDGIEHRVDYAPAESASGLFGGNSNWRGPIWFPVNFLLIESLQKFHYYLGDVFKVECPTGSKRSATLGEVAAEISRRLTRIFLRDGEGHRPLANGDRRFRDDPHWRDLVLFHEYFHGDTGAGLGASHQTGWTALAAKLLAQSGEAHI